MGRTTTMVPDTADRPDVLPSERLQANGMAIPEVRAELRRIDDGRNALTVATVWFWVVAIIGGAVWIDQWWSYLIAFVLMGPMYARFAILMHEAAHKLLFTNKRWNDFVGMWIVAYPVFTPVQLYRRVALRTPQGRIRPERAGPGVLRTLSLHATRAAAPSRPRRGGHQWLEELRTVGEEHDGTSRSGPSASPSSPCRRCCGR